MATTTDKATAPSPPESKDSGMGSIISSNSADPVIDELAEKRLVRKLDLHILPVLYVLYFLCFLDRSNIGNAKIQGMEQDLELTGNRYNITLFTFMITYILFQVPSNMLLRISRPSWYLASLVFCWGLVNMSMGFVQTFEALAGLRFTLGIFEAGLYPGIVYYTSMYYTRHEFQKRHSAVWSGIMLASAFSGLLAYLIAHMEGVAGYKSWRWIFILEGSFTVLAAFISVPFIADFPDQAKFLSTEEKDLLHRRLERDNAQSMEKLDRRAALRIVSDWKIWLTGILNFGSAMAVYSMNFFLPSILNELGWKAESAQIHTIPVYLMAMVLCLVSSVLSDHFKHRYAFIVVPYLFAQIGWALLLAQERAHLSSGAKYGAVFLGACQLWATPLLLTWLMNNLGGHWKRSIGAATANAVGNVAGVVASNVFLAREKPTYTTGYSVVLVTGWTSIISGTLLEILYYRENKKRERGERDWRLQGTPEEVANLSDDHPSFRFTL